VLLVLAGALAGVIIDHAVSSHGAAGPAALGKPAAASRPSASPRASAPATPTPPPPSPSPTPNPTNVTISLAAGSEPCWAQLTTASGTTVYQGILANGSTMSWTEGQAVTLTLGNPGSVTLTVNGKVQSGLGLNPVTLNLAPGQSSAG
jgi:hypothetical protein